MQASGFRTGFRLESTSKGRQKHARGRERDVSNSRLPCGYQGPFRWRSANRLTSEIGNLADPPAIIEEHFCEKSGCAFHEDDLKQNRGTKTRQRSTLGQDLHDSQNLVLVFFILLILLILSNSFFVFGPWERRRYLDRIYMIHKICTRMLGGVFILSETRIGPPGFPNILISVDDEGRAR